MDEVRVLDAGRRRRTVTRETALRYLDAFEPPTTEEGPLEVLEHHLGPAAPV